MHYTNNNNQYQYQDYSDYIQDVECNSPYHLPYTPFGYHPVVHDLTLFNNKGITYDFKNYINKLKHCESSYAVYEIEGLEVAFPINCDDRFCNKCCKRRADRYRKLIRNVFKRRNLYTSRHKLRFFTFNVKNFETHQLNWGLNLLNTCVKKLKQRKIYKENVLGGLQAYEITKNKNDGSWNLHFHMLLEGNYISFESLRDTWQEIVNRSGWTGNTVYIEKVDNIENAVFEMSKYLTKTSELDINDKYLLKNIFYKRRLITFLGAWYDSKEDETLSEIHPEYKIVKDVTTKGRLIGTYGSVWISEQAGWKYHQVYKCYYRNNRRWWKDEKGNTNYGRIRHDLV